MRSLILPGLWGVALVMMVVLAVVAVGQLAGLPLGGRLRVLADGYAICSLGSAAQRGDSRAVERVLTKRPDLVNAADYSGSTALHEAVQGGRTGVVRTLLRHEADVNARDYLGQAPLHSAARTGALAAARMLIEARADINARDKAGRTPLDIAECSGRALLSRDLLRHGAVHGTRRAEGFGIRPIHTEQRRGSRRHS